MDGHKRECQAVWVDATGSVVKEARFPTRIESLQELASGLEDRDRVAVEASSSGRLIHKVLRDAGVDVHLAMIVHGRDYDHALDGNVRKKAMEMRRKAQRERRPSAVAMTVAQLSSEILERIRQEGSVG